MMCSWWLKLPRWFAQHTRLTCWFGHCKPNLYGCLLVTKAAVCGWSDILGVTLFLVMFHCFIVVKNKSVCHAEIHTQRYDIRDIKFMRRCSKECDSDTCMHRYLLHTHIFIYTIESPQLNYTIPTAFHKLFHQQRTPKRWALAGCVGCWVLGSLARHCSRLFLGAFDRKTYPLGVTLAFQGDGEMEMRSSLWLFGGIADGLNVYYLPMPSSSNQQ